jgi:transcription antitermination protein NusB
MQGRRAAREIALLVLFHLESAQGVLPESVPTQPLETMMKQSVHTLVLQAKSIFKESAATLQQTIQTIDSQQFNHPVNLNSPLDAPVQSVPLPATKDTIESLDACLKAIEYLWEGLKIPELLVHSTDAVVSAYAKKLIDQTLEQSPIIESLINRYSVDWKASRLVKMDRLLLKLALAEMIWEPQVDLTVSVNEAVELSKLFSTEESFKFINGLLGKIGNDLSTHTLTLDNILSSTTV